MLAYYSIYDNSLKLSNPPFIARNDDDAKRIVRNFLLSSEDEILNKLSSCCSLIFCGLFLEDEASFSEGEGYKVCDLSDIPLPSTSVFDSKSVDGGV